MRVTPRPPLMEVVMLMTPYEKQVLALAAIRGADDFDSLAITASNLPGKDDSGLRRSARAKLKAEAKLLRRIADELLSKQYESDEGRRRRIEAVVRRVSSGTLSVLRAADWILRDAKSARGG